MIKRYDPYRTRGSVPPRGFGATDPYYTGEFPGAYSGMGPNDVLAAREREMEAARRAAWEEAWAREEAARQDYIIRRALEYARSLEHAPPAAPDGPVYPPQSLGPAAEPRYDRPDRTRVFEYNRVGKDHAQIARAGDYRSTAEDWAYRKEAQRKFDEGASLSEMNKFASDHRYPSFNQKELIDAIEWRGRNGKGAYIAAPTSQFFEPTLPNRAADTSAGQLIRSHTNKAFGGGLDEFVGGVNSMVTGRPLEETIAEANLQKGVGAAAYPTADAIGSFTGEIVGQTALGGITKAAGITRAAGRLGSGLNDVLYGAAYGFGENNDNRAAGAAEEAFWSGVGGSAARKAAEGAGHVLKLVDESVPSARPPIPGQRIMPDDGMAGRLPGPAAGGRWVPSDGINAPRPIVGAGIGDGFGGSNRAVFRWYAPEPAPIGVGSLAPRGNRFDGFGREADFAPARPFRDFGGAGSATFPGRYPALPLGSAPPLRTPPSEAGYRAEIRPTLDAVLLRDAPRLSEVSNALIRNRELGGLIGGPLLSNWSRDLWQSLAGPGVQPYDEDYFGGRYTLPLVTNYVVEPDR